MKRLEIILTVLVLAGVSFAQRLDQKPAQAQTQQQTPAKQGPAATAPAPAPAATGMRLPPQAKTQEEFKAYQDASAAATAADAEKAAEDFATKFKDSELRFLLYYKAMAMYQGDNNAEKSIEMGRKALTVVPNDPLTLAMVSTFLAEKTRDTDLDKDERLNEAMKDAERSLQTINTDLLLPPNIPPDQIENNKNLIRSFAYNAIANVYSTRENYDKAAENYRKSIELNTLQPDANGISYLRLAVVLDRQKKYQDALLAANKALDLSPAGSPQANMAKQERERLLKLSGAPTATPTAQPQAPPK